MFKPKMTLTLGLLAAAVLLLPAQSAFGVAPPKDPPPGGGPPSYDGSIPTVTWGSPTDPQVIVIEGKKLKIDHGAVVTGYGTLIIYGNLDIHHGALNWYGDIIVMAESPDGGKKGKGSKLHNHHGGLNVEGSIIMLGNGSKGKAKFDIHNTGKHDDYTTSIDGGVFMFGGAADDKDKVEFKAKHGNLTIDGLIAMMGSQVKIKIHPDNKKKGGGKLFNLNGGLVLVVPDDTNARRPNRQKADINLDGNVAIQYDSVKVAKALQNLLDFIESLDSFDPGPTKYVLSGGWRRFTPPSPEDAP